MEIRVIKELATIQLVEINEALKADNARRKRLSARIVFTYDGDNGEKGDTNDLQALLNSGTSGSTFSIIVDLNRMKMPTDITDKLSFIKEKLEGQRLKFSTFVVSVEELCKGRKSDGATVVNDGKTEMSSQSVSFPDWNTTQEYAERALLRRFADRLKRGKLRIGALDAKEPEENGETAESGLVSAQTKDDEIDF